MQHGSTLTGFWKVKFKICGRVSSMSKSQTLEMFTLDSGLDAGALLRIFTTGRKESAKSSWFTLPTKKTIQNRNMQISEPLCFFAHCKFLMDLQYYDKYWITSFKSSLDNFLFNHPTGCYYFDHKTFSTIFFGNTIFFSFFHKLIVM